MPEQAGVPRDTKDSFFGGRKIFKVEIYCTKADKEQSKLESFVPEQAELARY